MTKLQLQFQRFMTRWLITSTLSFHMLWLMIMIVLVFWVKLSKSFVRARLKRFVHSVCWVLVTTDASIKNILMIY